MTSMYNVLEALRQGRDLTAKERATHEQGLVTVLRELHDELDAAVAGAYGWPADLPDEEILSRLVALNAERVEEEKNGLIRWLRPEYQAKSKAERNATQVVLDFPQVAAPEPAPAPASRLPWPAALVDQMQAVRGIIAALKAANTPISAEAIAAHFVRASRSKVEEILQAFDTLGL